MAVGYNSKDSVELQWLDNRDEVTLKVRKITRRILNVVYHELSQQYVAALQTGEVLQLNPTSDELEALILDVTKAQLGG